jgi:hypothetical protein
MKELTAHMASLCSCVNIDLADPPWSSKTGVPNAEGWYFIRTSTPLEVLQKQALWSVTYVKKSSGTVAPVGTGTAGGTLSTRHSTKRGAGTAVKLVFHGLVAGAAQI